MTVTMYVWLSVSVVALAVLLRWLSKRDVYEREYAVEADRLEALRLEDAAFCYDLQRHGYEEAVAKRLWMREQVRVEDVYRADWRAFDHMCDDAERAQDAYEDYLDDAEDAAQEAFERRLRAEALTQSEL